VLEHLVGFRRNLTRVQIGDDGVGLIGRVMEALGRVLRVFDRGPDLSRERLI
jgi:hypothetical protein